jgi:hypothetical protein
MSKNTQSIVISFLLISLSILFAGYVENRQFSLPTFLSGFLNKARAELVELYNKNEILSLSKANTNSNLLLSPPQKNLLKQSVNGKNPFQSATIPIELHHQVSCLDKIIGPKERPLYYWIDSSGTRNISDKPRVINNLTLSKVIGTIKPENISISFSGDIHKTQLASKIVERVQASRTFFASITPQHLIKPISMDMRIFLDKQEYLNYQQQRAPELAASIGFYNGRTNETVVLIENEQQGLNTAVHEAMHALNRHWFGSTARWLNEGIAEYAEANNPDDITGSPWYHYIAANHDPISEILASNDLQWREQPHKMYGQSWAFIAFLVDEKIQVLTNLLLQESENGCDVLKLKDVERIYGADIATIQRDFNTWWRTYLAHSLRV